MAHEQVLQAAEVGRAVVAQFAERGQERRDKALLAAADVLLEDRQAVLAANAEDVRLAEESGMVAGGLDRLRVTAARVDELAEELRRVAELPGPLTGGLPEHTEVVRVPLGVIGVVYEPQPEITVLASAPILKAGNAVLLRGSPAAQHTDAALVRVLREALIRTDLPADAVQLLPVNERSTIRYLVSSVGLVDLVLLRAGVSLARRAQSDASVPIVELGVGICHLYLDPSSDAALARRLVIESKLRYPTRPGAAHTVLVHEQAAARVLPALTAALRAEGVTVRGDERAVALAGDIVAATDEDWRDEYLTLDLAIGVVDSLDDAVAHINRFGSGHTEVIVTSDRAAAGSFLASVDAASVRVNAPTCTVPLFATQKAHARGPLEPASFTTTKSVTWH
jgi:glutamate-5-semialdehyde dehydrogenase